MFDEYLRRWRLIPDGTAVVTRSSRLLPVRVDGIPAMLKIAVADEEKSAGHLMAWWQGEGAARALAQHGDALLLERAEGTTSLLHMALNGDDDEASRIICRVADNLHAPRHQPLPDLVPLSRWFQELRPAATTHGGILASCAATAEELLSAPREAVVLHGDMHHANVLDFGKRGWLAIDPKGLLGERGFDYAQLFCNPELANAILPTRFQRQLDIVSLAASLERRRLLQWIAAYAGLSAAWFLSDGEKGETAFAVAEFAATELAHLPSA